MSRPTRLLTLLLLLSLLAGLGLPAEAKRYNHPSGFSCAIPSDWTVKKDADQITGSTPDGDAAASFSVVASGVPVATLQAGCDQEMRKQLKGVSTDKPIESTVNDLKVVFVDGSGTMDNKPMLFTYAVYSKGDRAVVAVLLCSREKFATHKPAMVKILQSVSMR